MVRTVLFFQDSHFLGDLHGRPQLIAVPKDRLRTPVATEWTTTACNQVQRKFAVRFAPGSAVKRKIDQIARGNGQCGSVTRARTRTWLRPLRFTAFIEGE